MSDEVEVEFGEKPDETATLLLAAAEELDLPASVVRTGGGVFVVPDEVRKKAGLEEKKDESEESAEAEESAEQPENSGKKKGGR